MIGQTISHYRVTDKLGEGGMGAVYEAEDQRLGRHVALKFLPDSMAEDARALARFEREARAVSSLSHPHICSLYDIGEHEGRPFLVMECLEGKTLAEHIAAGPLDTAEILRLGIQIADALRVAHSRGLVHRDLKPANIFVTTDGNAKVLDFGLAKTGPWSETADTQAETRVSPVSLTRSGSVIGTVSYMSPEQALGKELDPRSDLFSLGVVLYEMASGRRPFNGDTPVSILNEILNVDPQPLTQQNAELPRDLDRIVDKCLEKDPQLRCQSAQELIADLKRIRRDASLGVSAVGETAPAIAAARPTADGKRLRWLLAAVAVVAALVAVTWWRLSRQPEGGRSETSSPTFVPFTSDRGWKATPALSPDGERVAYAWQGPTGDLDIYVKAIGSRSEPLRLTENPADEIAPAWSPDGRDVAFIRAGVATHSIRAVPSMGGQERKLTDLSGAGYPSLSWSPDGRWLTFSEAGAEAGTPSRVVLLSTETLEKTALTSPPAGIGGDLLPAFSPDGSSVAFVRRVESTWGNNDIWVQPVAGGSPRPVTSGHYQELLSLSWSPDGETVVFSDGPPVVGRTYRVPVTGGAPELVGGLGVGSAETSIVDRRMVYRQTSGGFGNLWRSAGRLSPTDERRPNRLERSNSIDLQPAISPDGTRIAFQSNRSGFPAIWWVDSDGGNPTRLTDSDHRAGTPNWSPDGTRIVFDSLKSGNYDLWIVEVEGGLPRQLTFEPSDDGTPSWSRDGRWIYFHSDRSGSVQIWRIPPAGGEAEPVTRHGGFYARESWDGETLYYAKTQLSTALWRLPTAGGDETEIVSGPIPLFFDWNVSRSGIYYFEQEEKGSELPDYGYRGTFDLFFKDLSTGETDRVFRLDGILSAFSPTISPDERWLVFTQAAALESELVLVEGFR